MSRVIAAYDLDEDHGRLWVNAILKRMPELVIVANQPLDRAQTVTYVPKTKVAELKAENAKLRGLVRAAWKCIHSGVSCSDCRLTFGGCTLQSAMRELGVVVDE